jgi:hypothetical protein
MQKTVDLCGFIRGKVDSLPALWKFVSCARRSPASAIADDGERQAKATGIASHSDATKAGGRKTIVCKYIIHQEIYRILREKIVYFSSPDAGLDRCHGHVFFVHGIKHRRQIW